MRSKLPLWLAAVVPAALAGHALAYALSGRSAADPQHAWVTPALECSLAFLVALCLLLVGGSLVKAGILMHTAAERSCAALWPRFALCQLAIFCAMERAEGARVGLLGVAVQALIALCAAYLLSLFARLLLRCIEGAHAASRYLERLFSSVTSFVSRRPAPIAYALAIHAGTSRFQRPPPIA
ncbi:MAG: hypothetical protein ACXWNK_15520 [Vulcanimicrobiaceae bacterium]